MTGQFPHVQVTVDILDILREFNQPSHFIVFAFIGIFDADPLGASKRDILDYTGLSRPTVEEALRFLEREEHITFAPETRRYRCAHYIRCESRERWDLHTLCPIKVPVKNSLTGHDDDVLHLDPVLDSDLKTSYMARKQIFAAAGFRGPNLDKIAGVDAPLERARAWADWVGAAQTQPKKYRQPFGYALKVYAADPCAEPPPVVEQKELPWYGEYAWMVHGNPAHARYKREHPGFFDCDCPEEEKE